MNRTEYEDGLKFMYKVRCPRCTYTIQLTIDKTLKEQNKNKCPNCGLIFHLFQPRLSVNC